MIVHNGVYKELELNIDDWSEPIPAWTPLTENGTMAYSDDIVYAWLTYAIDVEPVIKRAYVLVSGTLEAENSDDYDLFASFASSSNESGVVESTDGKQAFRYFTPATQEVDLVDFDDQFTPGGGVIQH